MCIYSQALSGIYQRLYLEKTIYPINVSFLLCAIVVVVEVVDVLLLLVVVVVVVVVGVVVVVVVVLHKVKYTL